MQEITFKGLGLKLNVNSIATSILNINIYWYAIFIVGAFIIGILMCIGQAIGRWGNFFNVEAYGNETTSILRMGIV